MVSRCGLFLLLNLCVSTTLLGAVDVAALNARLAKSDAAELLPTLGEVTELGSVAKETVPALTKLLGHGDAAVRGHAAKALGAIGPSSAPALAALTKSLGDSDATVRAYAAYAVGQLGDEAKSAGAALARALADTDPLVRRQALKAVRAIRPDPEVMAPALTAMLKAATPHETARVLDCLAEFGVEAVPGMIRWLKAPETTYWACLVLSEIGPAAKDAVPALVDVLKQSDVNVRREAMMTLGAIHVVTPQVINALAQQLNDRDPLIRAPAAYALGVLGPDANAAIPALHKVLEDSDNVVRTAAIWSLAHIEPKNEPVQKRARTALLALVGHERPLVRKTVAHALGADYASDPQVAAALVNLLLDSDEGVRSEAELGVLRSGAAALPALDAALKNDQLRPIVVRLLTPLGPELIKLLPKFVASLQDTSPDTRTSALLGITAIGPEAKSSVPDVTRLLAADKVAEVRRHAAFCLGRIGPGAASALPALKTQLSSTDPILSAASAWAIVHVDDPAKVDVAPLIVALTPALKQPDALLNSVALRTLELLGPRAAAAAPLLSTLRERLDGEHRAVVDAVLAKLGRP